MTDDIMPIEEAMAAAQKIIDQSQVKYGDKIAWTGDGNILRSLLAQIERDEEHYNAAMAMSEKHRKNWVEASSLLNANHFLGPWEASLCDDGQWIIHTAGDILAYASQGHSEEKARAICKAMNDTALRA